MHSTRRLSRAWQEPAAMVDGTAGPVVLLVVDAAVADASTCVGLPADPRCAADIVAAQLECFVLPLRPVCIPVVPNAAAAAG